MANSKKKSEQSFNTSSAFQLKTLPPASSNQINSVALFAFFNKQNSFKCEQNFTLLSHVFFFFQCHICFPEMNYLSPKR